MCIYIEEVLNRLYKVITNIYKLLSTKK